MKKTLALLIAGLLSLSACSSPKPELPFASNTTIKETESVSKVFETAKKYSMPVYAVYDRDKQLAGYYAYGNIQTNLYGETNGNFKVGLESTTDFFFLNDGNGPKLLQGYSYKKVDFE